MITEAWWQALIVLAALIIQGTYLAWVLLDRRDLRRDLADAEREIVEQRDWYEAILAEQFPAHEPPAPATTQEGVIPHEWRTAGAGPALEGQVIPPGHGPEHERRLTLAPWVMAELGHLTVDEAVDSIVARARDAA